MKNLNKWFGFIFILMSMMFIGSSSFALGPDELLVREYNKKASAAYLIPGDSTLVKISYVGVATQAVITITNDAFTTAAPIGTADLSYDLSAAAYDTLGEFCDAVNAEDDYNCVLTGGKRDDSSRLLTDVVGSASVGLASAAGGYDIGIDTGGAVHVASQYINRLGIIPGAGKSVVLKYCNVQSDAIGSVKVYGKLAKYASANDGVTRNDSTLLLSPATADDTAKTVGNIYGGSWLEFAKDAHVVISVGNATTAQTATSFIECFWDEK